MMIILRIVCYAALACVVAGFASLLLLSAAGVCSSLNEGNISCDTPFYTEIAKLGMTVALLSVFTGLPLLAASSFC